MKNLLYKTIAILLVLNFTNCSDDFLELEPKLNRTEANAYSSEADAMEAMVAVYSALAVQPWIYVPMQSDIVSDDAFTGGEPGGGMGQYQEQERGTVTPENGAAMDLWNKCYSGIYRANVYLEKEAGINWETDGRQDRMRAEVKVLRAHFYWDLVRHYGWVPLYKENLDDISDSKNPTQRTPDEVLTFIADELLTAIPDLPLAVGPDELGRITKDVARMLIARIYQLHVGFFQPVLGATAWVDSNGTSLDESFVRIMVDEILGSGRYSLMPTYAEVFDWDNENNQESIFEWQYSENAASDDWGGWGIRGNFSSVFYGPREPQGDPDINPGWSFGTMSWSLVDEYEPGDPRLNVTCYNADVNLTSYFHSYQNTGYFNAKYMPQSAYIAPNGNVDHNWAINYKDMRLAELYLIGAELNLTSNPVIAADYLNEVRVRAMGEPARLATIDLDDIYHERRVELAGEGHRKWDLLRRGLDYAKTMIDASWVTPDGIENPGDFELGVFNTNSWGMLPIPAAEIRLVNEGTLTQFVPAYQ
ncbi:MAG: RagB/SusD family nutrient uptake outer membrane protein [Reichenbachiella sp.]